MIKISICFLFFLSVESWASANRVRIDGTWYTFSEVKKNILVDTACAARQNLCIAVQKAQESKKMPRILSADSTNPGSRRCRDLEGRVVIGFDVNGNQNAFCKFSDGSFVDSGSLD